MDPRAGASETSDPPGKIARALDLLHDAILSSVEQGSLSPQDIYALHRTIDGEERRSKSAGPGGKNRALIVTFRVVTAADAERPDGGDARPDADPGDDSATEDARG